MGKGRIGRIAGAVVVAGLAVVAMVAAGDGAGGAAGGDKAGGGVETGGFGAGAEGDGVGSGWEEDGSGGEMGGSDEGGESESDERVEVWGHSLGGLTEAVSEEVLKEKRREGFPLIRVIDDGAELPDNVEYMGVQCNIRDMYSEELDLWQSDGSVRKEEVSTMELNNISVSVPRGGTRGFGVPVFSTEYYAEGEKEAMDAWHNVVGEDCPEFDEGMETARKLIREGYFQKPLEDFLLDYPMLEPEKREYRLYLTGGGRTDREEDDTSWWDLSYLLATTGENGENVGVAYIDITKVTQAQGYPTFDSAHYRIWSAESGYWRLLEDPAIDRGEAWISQVPEMDFTDEERVRACVEDVGGDFDRLVPSGGDRKLSWKCRKEEGYWYDYLIWSGTTDTYELTLAVPLMEPGAGGWYMASRIKKEAEQKELCHHALDVMRETFHEIPYYHTVKEGESLWSIYLEYGDGCPPYWDFGAFVRSSGAEDPDMIYPGEWVLVS